MRSIPGTTLTKGISGGKVLKWLLTGLLVLALVAWAWPGEQPAVQAAEPDLSLLAQAYRVSTLSGNPADGSPVVLPAAAFNADGSNRNWFFGFNSGNLYPTGAGSYCGVTAVSLPQGARITSFSAHVLDDEASADLGVYLYARPFASMDTTTSLASLSTTGQNASLQTLVSTTILPHNVDNNLYAYHVGVCMWSSIATQRFYTALVGYELPIYMPYISK